MLWCVFFSSSFKRSEFPSTVSFVDGLSESNANRVSLSHKHFGREKQTNKQKKRQLIHKQDQRETKKKIEKKYH